MDITLGSPQFNPAGKLPVDPAAPAVGGTAGLSPAEPDANDVERFQAAMNGPVGGTPQAANVPSSPDAALTATPPPEEMGLGDRILRGLGAVSDKVKADQMEGVAALGKKDLTQADLLRANFAILESSTIVSAVGKTAEKINQGIKTLQQG